MKNKTAQRICLLLTALMILTSFVACGNQEGNASGDESARQTAAGNQAETDPVQNALDAVRATVDWGGRDFGILYINDISGYTEEVEAQAAAGDNTSSGVINDAVYERNALFEEYGKLHFVLIPVSNASIANKLLSEVQATTGDFQLVTQTTSGTANAATSNYLYNYLDLDIDYDQEWWDEGTLDFALYGRVFFMNGSFNIVDDDVTFVMMFNKKLQSEYRVENPYETVKNNEWTLDKFNSIISGLSNDNGDGVWDEHDTYGFSTPSSIGNTFFYGAGLQYVRNSRSMEAPELALTASDMDIALNVLNLARQIVHENNSSYIAAPGSESKSCGIFVEGRSLYYVEAASYLRSLNKNMDSEYGVIPIPKYSVSQEHYTTWSHSIGSTLSIPASVASKDADMDAFADVLELYAVLSQKLVRPAYYEIMLTTRNVRDAESSEMLDIIFRHRIYDMAMYFETLGFSGIFSDSVTGANQFTSKYTSISKNFDKRMNNILKGFR